ncbi:RHS repeat-associated core domain-containing protein [Gilvimarinus algae]|uniref:RHS repeat-associated core domain-containing protein n=1 Tax=Gilvimarinus algae TaxID=3058037 RepID=A0ABT8TIS7_9GAMM|nr:RHS repeat-associated core domain-containing protein [Gilvimarinus sp. SDUM040014]MDO3383999.1 RHS repeat-associated core domain-containing protein [Gilvimarinus sp. SDUM040014]
MNTIWNPSRLYKATLVLLLSLATTEVLAKAGVTSNQASPHYSEAENLETFEDMRVKVLGGSVRMTRRWTGTQWVWNARWNGVSHGGGTSLAAELEQRINNNEISPADLQEPIEPPGRLFRASQAYVISHTSETETVYENRLKRFIAHTGEGYHWYDYHGNHIDYDRFGRMIAYRDKNGVQVTLNRDVNGYIQSVADHHGNTVITYTWEADPTQVPRQNLQGASYQPQRLKRLTDYTGRFVEYEYNADSQLLALTDVLGQKWQFHYGDNAVLTGITDPDERTTHYDIDFQGRVMSVIDSDGKGVYYTYNYDESKNRYYRSEEHTSGKVVELWFDQVGLLLSKSVNGEQEFSNSVTASNGSLGSDFLVEYYAAQFWEKYRNQTLIERHLVSCRAYNSNKCACLIDPNVSCPPPEEPAEPSLPGDLAEKKGLYIKYRLSEDARGRKTYTEYDQWGNRTKTTYPDGTSETATWDHRYSQPLSRTDERGTITSYEYDNTGNLLTLIEAQGTPDQRTTRYAYDEYGQLRELTTGESAAGNTELATTYYDYDTYGNLTQITDPMGHITTYSDYDALGNAGIMKDGRAHALNTTDQWLYDYDAAGNLLTLTIPTGDQELYRYSPAGDLRSVTSAAGVHYDIDTNAQSLPISLTDAKDQVSRLEYDGHYRLSGVVDAMGHSNRLEYNHRDQPVKVTDGEGNETTLAYEKTQLKHILYPTFKTELDYDARERVRQQNHIANGQNHYVKFGYDKAGNRTRHTDAKNQTESYVYDRLNRIVAINDAEEGETLFAYDARDNLLSVTDPEGRVTEFHYNLNNQRTQEIKPTGSRRYEYDVNGNQTAHITPMGEVTRMQYDAANRLVASELFASTEQAQPVKRVTYNVAGRDRYTGYQQSLGTDAANRTADIIALSGSYTYNGLGQVTSVTVNFGAFSKSYQYTYYPNGLKKTYTNPEGVTYTYYYNKNNQFAALHIPGAGQISHTNFQWMQPQTIVFPGGGQVQLSYEDFQRVKERVLKNPEQENMAQAVYDYDLVGDIETIDTEHGLYSFGYDSLYRLTEADYPVEVAANDESFGYDGVGNRTSHTLAPESVDSEHIESTYNAQNQLVRQTKNGEVTTFTYNDNGHTASKTTPQETVEYVYNREERLIAVKRDGVVVGEYAYDLLGRRIKKTANGKTTWFLYTDEGLAAEYDASGNLVAEYQFTPYSTWMTDPLMQRRGGQVYYYQNDHLGTPQRMVDTTGQVVWEARYEAFGKATLVTELVENNLRFPGQYFDGETGLHHNYHRYYMTSIGRYLRADPLGMAAGLNNYIYTDSSPLRYFDPLGLDKWDLNGRGDTSVCEYYDERMEETCGDLQDYYETAGKICRGDRIDVNTIMDAGIGSAWALDSTDLSQSEIYDQIRSDLISADSRLVEIYGSNAITGNMIDSYHDEAFDKAGIGSGFYGGNLWPQGVFPNPVPFDDEGKSNLDPRNLLPSNDECSC